jgi:hypothetical protein
VARRAALNPVQSRTCTVLTDEPVRITWIEEPTL